MHLAKTTYVQKFYPNRLLYEKKAEWNICFMKSRISISRKDLCPVSIIFINIIDQSNG